MSVEEMRAAYGQLTFMEITGRDHIGADLIAPQQAAHGRDAYGLIREPQPGDLVVHYYRETRDIVGMSRVVAGAVEDVLEWAARSASARQRGDRPWERDAWRVDLADYTPLDPPLPLAAVVANRAAVLRARGQVEKRFGRPTHFPYVPYRDGLRTQQAYLTLFQPELLALFPDLDSQLRRLRRGSGRSRAPAKDAHLTYLAHEDVVVELKSGVAQLDPAVRTAALRLHNRTQNQLAERVKATRGAKFVPAGKVNVDVAWTFGRDVYFAEVKSLTEANETFQLRLGLGELLDFLDEAAADGEAARGVLFVSRPPVKVTWVRKCRSVGVELCWPGNWPSSLS